MPRKWTHLEFMMELAYDLIFPGKTKVHLSTIGELDNLSIDSTRSFSSFTLVDEAQLDMYGTLFSLDQSGPRAKTRESIILWSKWGGRAGSTSS